METLRTRCATHYQSLDACTGCALEQRVHDALTAAMKTRYGASFSESAPALAWSRDDPSRDESSATRYCIRVNGVNEHCERAELDGIVARARSAFAGTIYMLGGWAPGFAWGLLSVEAEPSGNAAFDVSCRLHIAAPAAAKLVAFERQARMTVSVDGRVLVQDERGNEMLFD